MNNETLSDFIKNYESQEKKFVQINFSEINIGDVIYILFYPYSQKYIDDLTPIFGTVTEIKNEFPNVLNFDSEIKFDTQTIERLVLELNGELIRGSHEWVSYFGNSRGYEYTIYKLKNILSSRFNKKNNLYISSESSDDEIHNYDNISYDNTNHIAKKLKKTH